MNIVISSAMLAVAILMVAHSIYELGPQHINEKERPEKTKKKTRTIRVKRPTYWDRIMEETELYRPPVQVNENGKKN